MYKLCGSSEYGERENKRKGCIIISPDQYALGWRCVSCCGCTRRYIRIYPVQSGLHVADIVMLVYGCADNTRPA